MGWDWATDTFKVLLVPAILGVVAWLRQKARPLIKTLLKFSKLIEHTQQLKEDVATLKSLNTALYDISKDPLFILNPKGEIIYANGAYAKMGGLNDPRDAYGFGWMAIIPEDDKAAVERISQMSRDHPSPFEGEVRFKNRNTGNIFITECRTSLFYDVNGKLVGTLGRIFILD